MRFSIYQESKRGGRKMNQDRMGYCFTRESLLIIVCDGMGGHLHGEIAAQIAVQSIGNQFQKSAQPTLPDPKQFLEDALLAAHIEIQRYKAGRNLPESPRTTVVACIVQGGMAVWAHAGDTRLYLIRNGYIETITRDHSQLEAMIADGTVNEVNPDDMPDRNRLFNCLGAPAMPMIELSDPVRLVAGDHLLLCSDGLWGAVPDNIIAAAFRTNSVMSVVPELINHALREAGPSADNVTAVGMTWEGVSAMEETQSLSLQELRKGQASKLEQGNSSGATSRAAASSEDDIESAIAEIKRALANSTKSTDPK